MKRYKYKLNMLEPGCRMIKAIGLLGAVSFVLYLLKIYLLCFIFVGIAATIGLILFILLIIESHQDNVLNEQALQERKYHRED